MVNYNCKICGKVFNKKSNYLQHSINKKKPCRSNNNIQNKDNEKLSQIITKNAKFSENDKKNTSLIIKNEDKCLYCLKNFANIYNLKRHTDKYCKVKKLDKEKKEEIFNKLIEKEEKIDLMFTNYEKLHKNNLDLQQNNCKLQDQIKELEKKLKEQSKNYDNKIKQIITKNVNNNNVNNGVINNFIIPADKLVSFGKEDLSKITYGSIIKTVGNWDITGYRIFTELLKLIHFNEKFPEYQNVYMTDKNREKYMVWNGSDWVLNDICLKQIIDKIQKLVVINEEDFEEAKKNKNFKDILIKLMKYINKYYDEKEGGIVNHDFIELVNKQLKEYLYNNRGIPRKNFLKLKNDITNNKSDIKVIDSN